MKKNHGTFVSLLINPQKKQIAAYSNSVYVPIDLELLTDEEINFAKGIFLSDYIK